jgi:Dual OB-containing domain
MAGDRVCVGGIDIDSRKSLRLLGSDGRNLPESKPIRPSELWDLTYAAAPTVEPPHVEDVIVSRGRKVGDAGDMKATILELVVPWGGNVETIFGGRLDTTDHGTAFLRRDPTLPGASTGFWVASDDVRRSQFDDFGVKYWFPNGRAIRRVTYKGMGEPIEVIPAGSLVRFSLARWAEFPPGVGEERCYLQLSGWYL